MVINPGRWEGKGGRKGEEGGGGRRRRGKKGEGEERKGIDYFKLKTIKVKKT